MIPKIPAPIRDPVTKYLPKEYPPFRTTSAVINPINKPPINTISNAVT